MSDLLDIGVTSLEDEARAARQPEFNIYDDLIITDSQSGLAVSLPEVYNERKRLQYKVCVLTKRLEDTKSELCSMANQKERIESNYNSLLITAKLECQRKNRVIEELQDQLRSMNPHNKWFNPKPNQNQNPPVSGETNTKRPQQISLKGKRVDLSTLGAAKRTSAQSPNPIAKNQVPATGPATQHPSKHQLPASGPATQYPSKHQLPATGPATHHPSKHQLPASGPATQHPSKHQLPVTGPPQHIEQSSPHISSSHHLNSNIPHKQVLQNVRKGLKAHEKQPTGTSGDNKFHKRKIDSPTKCGNGPPSKILRFADFKIACDAPAHGCKNTPISAKKSSGRCGSSRSAVKKLSMHNNVEKTFHNSKLKSRSEPLVPPIEDTAAMSNKDMESAPPKRVALQQVVWELAVKVNTPEATCVGVSASKLHTSEVGKKSETTTTTTVEDSSRREWIQPLAPRTPQKEPVKNTIYPLKKRKICYKPQQEMTQNVNSSDKPLVKPTSTTEERKRFDEQVNSDANSKPIKHDVRKREKSQKKISEYLGENTEIKKRVKQTKEILEVKKRVKQPEENTEIGKRGKHSEENTARQSNGKRITPVNPLKEAGKLSNEEIPRAITTHRPAQQVSSHEITISSIDTSLWESSSDEFQLDHTPKEKKDSKRRSCRASTQTTADPCHIRNGALLDLLRMADDMLDLLRKEDGTSVLF